MTQKLQRLLPFATLALLFTGLSLGSPHFLTATNLSSVVRQTAVINIMALGMTMIIIAGGIDLSVGAILAMGGLLGTMAMEKGMSIDRKSTRLNSSHSRASRMPSSA